MNLNGTIQEKCTKLYAMADEYITLLQSNIIHFINFQKERIEKKEISEGTLCNYIKALKLFCNMNDIVINWKKIAKGLPTEKHNADDRIPTIDEIHKLLQHPDRRIKPIVYVMVSSGIRIGSWDYLKWKHVIPIKDNDRDKIIAARINVRNTKINNREYYSFITPEAYNSLKDWMEFRQLHGEEVNGESWLMRDIWQKTDKAHGHRIGLAKFPKRLTSSAIKNIIYEAWKIQGIRDKLSSPNVKRYEFKSTHGFRKFFETKCQIAKMNHNNIKLLMDHSLGESQNYHRPLEVDVLEDYLTAVDLLTINEENRLRKKVEMLTIEKSKADLALLQIEEVKNKKIVDDLKSKFTDILHTKQRTPARDKKPRYYYDLLQKRFDIETTIKIERQDDVDTIANKAFDFSPETISSLIEDGIYDTLTAIRQHHNEWANEWDRKSFRNWLKTYIEEIKKQNIEGILEPVLQFKADSNIKFSEDTNN